ncbi:MAG: hypothetical protein ACRD9Q_03070 [Nitrososphaeraceae archaeon]
METKDSLYLIAIIIGLAGTIFGGLLSDMQFFKIYPNFDVWTVSVSNNNTNLETLTVINKERIQAKNALIHVLSNGILKVNDSLCLEGSFPYNSSKNIFRIDFGKMSAGIICRVGFESPLNVTITRVVITADDSPGREYFPAQKQESQSGNATLTFVTFKEEVGTTRFFDLMMLIAIVELISIISLLVYRQVITRKMRKELEIVENEIKNSLEKTKEEYDTINKSTILQEATPPYLRNRMDSLRDRIIAEKRNLDEVRSKMTTYRGLHKLTGEFFEEWSNLENQLILLAHRHNVEIQIPSAYSIAEQLLGQNLINQDFFDKLSKLRKFRNNLAHGLARATKSELETVITNLKELIDSLKKKDFS